MSHPAIELQEQIIALLSAHDGLQAVLGAGRLHDHVPARVKPPYVRFSKSDHTDWSTATEGGTLHTIELEVWSDQKGRKQVLQIDEEIRNALVDQYGPMQGHYLIRVSHLRSSVLPEPSTKRYVCRITFEAVTEPMN